jgi:hypothetical protein
MPSAPTRRSALIRAPFSNWPDAIAMIDEAGQAVSDVQALGAHPPGCAASARCI